jgi:hypothetical protein
MAWIIFAVIAGLSLFQFWQARQFYLADMAYDCIWRFIVGVIFAALALMFGLGVLLG